MRAQSLTARQCARLLGTDPAFLAKLTAHRMFPRPLADGTYDAGRVAMARRLHPWMAKLAVPMSERELVDVDPRLFIPAGLGFNQAGVQYATLASVLDAFWPDPKAGHKR